MIIIKEEETIPGMIKHVLESVDEQQIHTHTGLQKKGWVELSEMKKKMLE